MTFDEYQKAARRTSGMKDRTWSENVPMAAMGLAGEAGELIDRLKKIIYHKHPITKEELEKISKEIGDVCWYLAELATSLGIDLDQAAAENIEKLKKRYPDKFSPEASMARVDTKPASVCPEDVR